MPAQSIHEDAIRNQKIDRRWFETHYTQIIVIYCEIKNYTVRPPTILKLSSDTKPAFGSNKLNWALRYINSSSVNAFERACIIRTDWNDLHSQDRRLQKNAPNKQQLTTTSIGITFSAARFKGDVRI